MKKGKMCRVEEVNKERRPENSIIEKTDEITNWALVKFLHISGQRSKPKIQAEVETTTKLTYYKHALLIR